MHDFESAIGCKRTLTRVCRAEQRQRIPPESIACRRHTLTLLRTARCHAVAPPFRFAPAGDLPVGQFVDGAVESYF
jgi:hypothetical protein